MRYSLYLALIFFVIFICIYGIVLSIKKLNLPKDFVMSLFTNSSNSSTTKFVFILSGVISTFALWGTWMFCQVANIYYTHAEDVLEMVEIPMGVYCTYAIALVGPGAIRLGQSIFGKKIGRAFCDDDDDDCKKKRKKDDEDYCKVTEDDRNEVKKNNFENKYD
jgi:hypothetical protein